MFRIPKQEFTAEFKGNPPFLAESEVELRGHGQPLFRGEVAQRHGWAVMIVVVHPLRREQPDLIEVFPEMPGQPFVPHRPVEALDIGTLLRLAGLDVVKADYLRGRLIYDARLVAVRVIGHCGRCPLHEPSLS